MEWLKDKKNLPIVAGLGILVLIIALVAVLFETGVIGGSGGGNTTATTQVPSLPQSGTAANPQPQPLNMPQGSMPGSSGRPMMPGQFPGGPGGPGGPSMAPGMPHPFGATGAPGGPGIPGSAATAAIPSPTGTVATTSAPINFKTGPDPFFVATGLSKTIRKPVRPVRTYAPPVYIASINTGTSTPTTLSDLNIRLTPQESPTERVSGVVLTGNGVHAVLEANGQSQTVQPGDSVTGGKVVSIQSDGLILRSDAGQLVHVPLSAGDAGGTSAGGGYPGGQGVYNTSYPGEH